MEIIYVLFGLSDTTDVQRAIVRLDHSHRVFEVSCIFLVGSKAKGCFFALNGTSENVSAHILRNDSFLHHVAHPLELEDSFSVFDWEEDGSIGDVAVPVQLINASLEVPTVELAPSGTSAVHQFPYPAT